MCGRISCHMCRPDYRKATSYFDEAKGHYVQPDWIDTSNCGLDYAPSTNMAPTDILPVVLSKHHERHSDDLNQRIIKPMMWGMVPPWHKGDYKSHGLTTNNCRIEGLVESRLYGKPLRDNQRCIIACQGFYEWQTTKQVKQKQPYFVKALHKSEVGPAEDESSWEQSHWSEAEGWTGPRLLLMAGLFDKWISPQGDELFSFTVITMESDNHFNWLHHRVPAILDSEQLVSDWLDHRKIDGLEAIKLLKPVVNITWHPVSTTVNNSRNKHASCNKPIDLSKPKPSNKIMDSWLKRAAPKADEDETSKMAKTYVFSSFQANMI